MFDWIETALVRLDAWFWRQRYGSRAQERREAAKDYRPEIAPAKCGDYDVFKFPCG